MTDETPIDVQCRTAQEEQIKKVGSALAELKNMKTRVDALRVTEIEVDELSDKIDHFWSEYEWQGWEPQTAAPNDAIENVLGEIDSAIDQYETYLQEITEELEEYEKQPFDDDGEDDDEDDEDSEDDEDADDEGGEGDDEEE